MLKQILLLTIATLLITFIAAFGYVYIDIQNEKYYEELYKEHLWKLNLGYNMQWDTSFNGIYYAGKGYCVITKDRTPLEQFGSESHEQCHEFIFKNNTHFCKNE